MTSVPVGKLITPGEKGVVGTRMENILWLLVDFSFELRGKTRN